MENQYQQLARGFGKRMLEVTPLFTDEVITEIHHHAKGLPRVINTLCYDCLWEIYELQKSLVDLPTLERVLCRYDEG